MPKSYATLFVCFEYVPKSQDIFYAVCDTPKTVVFDLHNTIYHKSIVSVCDKVVVRLNRH